MPYVSCIQQVSSGPVTAAAVKKERIKYKNKKDKEKKEKRKKVNGKGKLKTGRSIRTAQWEGRERAGDPCRLLHAGETRQRKLKNNDTWYSQYSTVNTGIFSVTFEYCDGDNSLEVG